MTKLRQERFNALIKQNIAKIIYENIRDKRIKNITIEQAKVSPDLHNATIYFSLQDDKKKKSTLIALQNARKFIRKRLAQILNLRYTPEIKFEYDSLEKVAFSVEKLIESEGKKYDN
ncbi:MAG: 30S ribosome-binding factor RbfA [Candidatus Cloacimonetes bacterium]|nr:30S ribosome-binding factor RbfA [Candidatus Cloacimonadota bacterium]MBL7086042.1 30S ribosome-binding factor RbfA [Candidatus Cloacimonadota bacterium]